jgi:glycosyltransferase involved in cell wall biosynthesis
MASAVRPSGKPLAVAMLTPTRERCGIADYSRLLESALRALPGVAALNTISVPEGSARIRSGEALAHYLSDERRFAALGARLNSGDVAHIQHQYFFFGGVAPHKNHFRALLKAVRVPLVVTVHEIADGTTAGWKRSLLELTNRRNFLPPVIRQIIVHTEADWEKLRALGVSDARLTVLPVGVPPPLPLPDRDTARAELGLTAKRALLMFGFLSAKKGHALALEALRGLPEDVVLVFAGEKHPDDPSDYVVRLMESIRAPGLENRVVHTGYLRADRVPAIMAAADVALAPFTESSGSASLAHLLAYGLPVVASDIAPHRDLLAQTPGSLRLFSNGQSEALREQIAAVLEDTALRRSLHAGAAQFRRERSFERLAQETLAVYRKAVTE